MSSDLIFELRDVGFRVDGTPILDGVTFSLAPGEKVALVGHSGSGKSTLLRLLARLDDPTGGEIRFRGRGLTAVDPLELRLAVRLVFQDAVSFPGTVTDNLDLAAAVAGRPLDGPARLRLLDAVGLPHERAEADANRLSGGERQRLSLARALVVDPQVLCLDEPTAHLDGASARTLLHTARLTPTTVVATHDLALVRGFATKVLLVEGGRLVEEAPAERFFAGPSTEVGRRLLDEAR